MNLRLFLSIVTALMSINSFAQSSHATVVEFVNVTGSTLQFQRLDEFNNKQMEGKKSTFKSEESYNKFAFAMKSFFTFRFFENNYIKYLEQHSNKDSLRKIISIYNSPLLKEMNKFEKEANDSSRLQEKKAFYQNINNNPPSNERMQQYNTLNEAIGESEMTMMMIQDLRISLAKAFNSILPKEKQIPIDELYKKDPLPEDLPQKLVRQIVSGYVFTYKDVSDEKLSEYIGIWQSPLGHYYKGKKSEAVDYVFSVMAQTLAEECFPGR